MSSKICSGEKDARNKYRAVFLIVFEPQMADDAFWMVQRCEIVIAQGILGFEFAFARNALQFRMSQSIVLLPK